MTTRATPIFFVFFSVSRSSTYPLIPALDGNQIVGFVEIHAVDLFGGHKVLQLDGLGRLYIRLFEILVPEQHVLVLLVLVPLDDVVPGHLFAGLFIDPLVPDLGLVPLVDQVEVQFRPLFSGIERDRDVDQAEGYVAFPDGTGHGNTSKNSIYNHRSR